jgi:hypothetical protein
MSINFLSNRAGFAALITVAWGLLMMRSLWQYPYPHVFHHDVDSPVIALEISRGPGDIDAVLHRSDREKRAKAVNNMAFVNRLDLVFIPLYAFSIWSLARVFTTKTRLLALAVSAAAVFDYLEDAQIYRALVGENPAIFIPSLIKWGLLGLIFIALSRILLRSDSPVYTLSTKRLLAIGYFVSGALILMDVALGQWIGYSYIGFSMSIFSVLMVVNVVGLLGHYLALPGIKQTFVEHFCDERKKLGDSSLTAVRGVKLTGKTRE